MKPQDIVFILALLLLLWKRNPQWLVVAGLVCLVVSMPLFAFWVFFTAQHLVWYAGGFFLAAILLSLFKKEK